MTTTDTEGEAVARLRKLAGALAPSGEQWIIRDVLDEAADLIATLSRQLAEAQGVIERQNLALREITQLVGYGVRHDLGDAIKIAQDAIDATPPPSRQPDNETAAKPCRRSAMPRSQAVVLPTRRCPHGVDTNRWACPSCALREYAASLTRPQDARD